MKALQAMGWMASSHLPNDCSPQHARRKAAGYAPEAPPYAPFTSKGLPKPFMEAAAERAYHLRWCSGVSAYRVRDRCTARHRQPL